VEPNFSLVALINVTKDSLLWPPRGNPSLIISQAIFRLGSLAALYVRYIGF
jgi:hypothetical protein